MSPASRVLPLALAAALAAPAPALAAPRDPAPGQPALVLLVRHRRGLEELPPSPGRERLLEVLRRLEDGAARREPAEREAWISERLGDLAAAAASLAAGPEPELSRRARRAALELCLRAARWREARDFAALLTRESPEDAEAWTGAALASRGLGEPARAFEEADRAAGLDPGSGPARAARALAAYDQGRYLEAARDARRALDLNPNDPAAFTILSLSRGLEAPGEVPSAPAPPRAAALEDGGGLEQVRQAGERLREPERRPGPDGPARLAAAAGAKLALGDYWGALEDSSRALELAPENSRARYARAVAHNLLGRHAEAVREAGEGLAYSPAEHAFLDARSWALNRLGRPAEAEADANRSLELDPVNPYAFANRALARELAGRAEAGLDDWKAAAALSPLFEPALRGARRRLSGERPGEAPPPSARRGWRSLAAVLLSSLVGGALVATGLLRARGGAETAPRPSSGIDARYRIGPPLGRGGMGVVYEAVDRRLGREVAVKRLREEACDEASRAALLEEAKVVAALSHPGIVEIYAVEEDEAGSWLVFERLRGRTLEELLARRGRLALGEARAILGPVCSALEHAHSRGVVHRDLKPANIMVLDAGGVKVLDFGISRRAAAAGTTTRTFAGTPAYMAPEQERGEVRPENDVFALGACLYEALTGRRAFIESPAAKLAGRFPPASSLAPGLPPGTDELLARALDPDPGRRPRGPGEFQRLLEALPG